MRKDILDQFKQKRRDRQRHVTFYLGNSLFITAVVLWGLYELIKAI